jgi:hypothetical protein
LRSGLYLSETKEGNLYEAIHYNGGTANRDLYEFTEAKVEGLLDLTNEKTIKSLGTTFEQMKLIKDKGQYEFTYEMAVWAKNKGYKGIKFFGARGGAEDYVNFVIFEENTVSKSLSNFKKTNW